MPKLVVHRNAGGEDKNEGSGNGRRYLNTPKRQGYTTQSEKGAGGTLFGGKAPGRSNRSATGAPQRAGQNDDFISGKRKVLANNNLQAQEDFDSERPPRLTQQQSADLDKRAADYYANKLKKARRSADKKRLGKQFNGSTTSVSPRYRGTQNA